MPGPSALPAQTLRAFSIALLFMTCTVSARAQAPPTADQLKTIQKCNEGTAKLNELISVSFSVSAAASATIDQLKTLTADPSTSATQTFPALARLSDAGLPVTL